MAILPVVVYGNGELYRELFNAISLTLNTSSFGHLVKFVIALTGTWVIIRYSMERNLQVFLRWLLLYYVAFYIVFIPKVTVTILDQLHPGKAYSVDNVPLGLGVMASYTSSIGAGLTELIEKNFSLPDDLSYQKTGLAMGSRLVLAATQFESPNPDFTQSMHSFMNQCVFYDLFLQKYSWHDLVDAKDIWALVSQEASPARSFRYNKGGKATILTCKAGISPLNRDWKETLLEASTRYGAWSFPNEKNAKALLLSHLESSYHFLTNLSDHASNLIQQALMANLLESSALEMSSTNNAPAALEAYAFVKAQAQKRLTHQTVGDMAAYWLPLMKNVLEATLYGVFIFVFLLFLFPFGPTILKNYVASLLWIQCWAPLYAILNLFINFYAQNHCSSIANKGFSLSSIHPLAQANADIASLAGYLSLSVPLLAAGISKGLMSVFSQAASSLGGVTQSAAAGTSTEAAGGNFSLGNTQFSNHSNFNTANNHVDTNARVLSGMYTTQMAGGSQLSMALDGSTIMNNQSSLSSLGTSINLAHAIRSQASTQAEKAYSSALNFAQAYSESISSSLRDIYEFGHHLNKNEASGTHASLSLSSGTQFAINSVHQLTDRFAKAHHISNATALKHLSAAYGQVRGGVNFTASTPSILPTKFSASAGVEGGVRAEVDKLRSSDQGELYSAARDFVQNTQYADHIDTAVRGIQETHYRSNDEEGERLSKSIGSSFDKASHLRHEMMAHYAASQSYRQMASEAEENATTINSNANQVFIKWLQAQPELQHPSSIEKLMTNEPEKAELYAKRFTEEQVSQAIRGGSPLEGWREEDIKANYQKEASHFSNEKSIQAARKANDQEVGQSAHHLVGHPIHRQTVTEVDNFIHQNKNNMNKTKESISEHSRQEKTEVHDHLSHRSEESK